MGNKEGVEQNDVVVPLKERAEKADLEGKLALLEGVLAKWPEHPEFDHYQKKAEKIKHGLRSIALQKSLKTDDVLGESILNVDNQYLEEKEQDVTKQLSDLFAKLDRYNQDYDVANQIVKLMPNGVMKYDDGTSFEGVVAKLKDGSEMPYGKGILTLPKEDGRELEGVWKTNNEGKLEIKGLTDVKSPEGTYKLWHEDNLNANGVFVDKAGKVYAINIINGVKHILDLPEVGTVTSADAVKVEPPINAKLPDTGEIGEVTQIEVGSKKFILASEKAYSLQDGGALAYDQEFNKEGQNLAYRQELLEKMTMSARLEVKGMFSKSIDVLEFIDQSLKMKRLIDSSYILKKIDLIKDEDGYYLGEIKNGKPHGLGLRSQVYKEENGYREKLAIKETNNGKVLAGGRVVIYDVKTRHLENDVIMMDNAVDIKDAVGLKFVRKPGMFLPDGKAGKANVLCYAVKIKDGVEVQEGKKLLWEAEEGKADALRARTVVYAKGGDYVFKTPEGKYVMDAQTIAVK